jgi:hypothetical protein
MKEKISDLFSEAFNKIKPEIIKKSSWWNQVSCSTKLQKWQKYIEGLEGVCRKSKIIGLILEDDDEIKIKDPSSQDSVITIKKEIALRILTLGYLPEIQQENQHEEGTAAATDCKARFGTC